MRGDNENNEDFTDSHLFRRGVPVYYIGSMLFAVGIALIGLGTALIMIFQLHYGSDPQEILYTVLALGTGITLIMLGINLMIRETTRGYIIVAFSAILSTGAIVLFYTNYLTNWFYPLIGYVFGLYVLSFLILMGNAFANVILWIMEKTPTTLSGDIKEPGRIYTDEEIQRDIDEATQRAVELAAANLEFDIESTPENSKFDKLVMGVRGHITRVKDDIVEAVALTQTMHPESTEKWGSIGIDQASDALSKTMNQKKEETGFFTRFKRIFSR
jgi:hypothetical protein